MHLTEEIKEKIKAEKKPVLSDVKTFAVSKNDAFSEGMRTVLVSSRDSSKKLSVKEIASSHKFIFTEVLPSIYTQMGLDLVQHLEFNF